MKIKQTIQLAWEKDSLYMKTVIKNATVGFIAGRIFGVVSPMHSAIFALASEITECSMQEFALRYKIQQPSKKIMQLVAHFVVYRKVCSLLGQSMSICRTVKHSAAIIFIQVLAENAGFFNK